VRRYADKKAVDSATDDFSGNDYTVLDLSLFSIDVQLRTHIVRKLANRLINAVDEYQGLLIVLVTALIVPWVLYTVFAYLAIGLLFCVSPFVLYAYLTDRKRTKANPYGVIFSS
jgi:hypothetical protein